MPLVNSDLQLIENYLRDQCTPEELVLFKEKISSNQEFKNAYTVESLISKEVIAAEKESMKGLLTDIHAELTAEGFFEEAKVVKGNFFQKNRVAMALAASFMLLFSAIFLINRNDNDVLFADVDLLEQEFLESRISTLGELGFASTDQDEAKIELLNKIVADDISTELEIAPTDNESIYFNGLLEFKLGKYDEALKSFKAVMNSEDRVYKERASLWYARIAISKSDVEKKEALAIFRRLSESDSQFKSIAIEVLNEYE